MPEAEVQVDPEAQVEDDYPDIMELIFYVMGASHGG